MSQTVRGSLPSVLRHPPFALFWVGRILSNLSFNMLTVAVGWQLYDLTGDPLDLGLAGLVQFVPVLVLTLVVGQVADCYDRRAILAICRLLETSAGVVLALGSFGGWLGRDGILAVVAVVGVARAFEEPTQAAMLPTLVPRALLSRATALSTSGNQIAKIAGPALGGVLYIFGPTVVYVATALCFLSGAVLVALVRGVHAVPSREPLNLATVFSGITFIRRKPVILGALSLDLFVVLLGGATALLPVYARDVLDAGPVGLGLLRTAPGIGALVISIWLAGRSLDRHVGTILYAVVILFGLATIVFGVSTHLLLSLGALAVLGAADVVSVVIRVTLVQLQTPDAMRGRVNAVSSMFTTTSNRLGEFESGLAAALVGTVPAVLIGGVGTILVALVWMYLFPELRRVQRLDE